jgi:hypothetical protein
VHGSVVGLAARHERDACLLAKARAPSRKLAPNHLELEYKALREPGSPMSGSDETMRESSVPSSTRRDAIRKRKDVRKTGVPASLKS